MLETKIHPDSNVGTKTNKKFPNGFLWGAGTSSYQVEGGLDANDWARSNKVPKAGDACDHYNRYATDFAIARDLGHNSHRLSLEWSRIEPEPGKWNEAELKHYHDVLEDLKNKGFTTFVTLHHFTNPVWVAEQKGWESNQTADRFTQYVAKVAQSLGHLIDFWITINEPNIYAAMAYTEGKWPPHKKSIVKTSKVYDHMLHAHNNSYDVIHSYYPDAKVGFAQNITFTRPKHKTLRDRIAARILGWADIGFPYGHTKNDFIGVNHYFNNRVHVSFKPEKNFIEFDEKRGDLTDRGWEIYPEALYQVLLKLKDYNLPVYITENGLADAKDQKRARFISSYLSAVLRAIDKGVLVKGYLHWALMDNFEWEDGYQWKFGLVEVDFETQERKVRPSAYQYKKICESNELGS